MRLLKNRNKKIKENIFKSSMDCFFLNALKIDKF